MNGGRTAAQAGRAWAIWLFAAGYFGAYVPYSALTKAVSSAPGMDPLAGVRLLPSTAVASLLGTWALLAVTGWWRAAGRLEVGALSLPRPGVWTLLSGLCSAVIIASTTLAYTFTGTSIVFMMLLMRGGVLALAPLVDALSRRRVSWNAWLGLGLSAVGVVVASARRTDLRFSAAAALVVAAYLLAYFGRLRFMSHVAKTSDSAQRLRYFVEEQLVSTPALVAALLALSFGVGLPQLSALREGFAALASAGPTWQQLAIGLCSQGTGIFGALILLQPQENSYCVPVNRASSILAGVVASALLAALGLAGQVGGRELFGAALVLAAMAVLALPSTAPSPARTAPDHLPTGSSG